MFYFLIFIILFIFAACDIDKKLNANSRNIVLIFLFLVFWLVAGLRYETGTDWMTYTQFYNQIDNIAEVFGGSSYVLNDSPFEIGYTLVNSVLKVFTDNIQWLFLLIAFVTNLMLFFSLKKYSSHIFISLLIYFCIIYLILDMSGIRQCIALNIFLCSLNYIIRKKICKYFLAIFIASLFHQAAWLLLPMYFFLNREFKNSTYLIFVGIGIIFALFQIHWIQPLVDYSIGFHFSESLSGKLYFYGKFINVSRSFGIGFIGNLLILVFCLVKRNDLKTNKMFKLFLNMYILNLVFYYFTWELWLLSSRYRLYFLIGNVVLLTYFVDVYKDRLKKYLVFVFIIFYCLSYGKIYFFEYPEGITHNPYQNYLLYKIFGIKSTGLERLDIFESTIAFKKNDD